MSEDLVLFIDPAVVARWTVPELAGVLLHEVGHVVRDHAARARTMSVGNMGDPQHDAHDRLAWNIAGDAEINDDLIADGAELPDQPVTPKRLSLPSQRTAEFYFSKIRGRRSLPDHDCGGGAHGHEAGHPSPFAIARAAADAQQRDARPPGSDGDDDSPWFMKGKRLGLDPAEVELIRMQIAKEILMGKAGRGVSSGGWQRWAESFQKSVIDWRTVLRRAIRTGLATRAGRSDYSYSRPSRRQVPGVVLPSTVSPLSTVGIVIDTSASMPDEWVSQAWTETLTCLRSVGLRRDLLRAYGTDTSAVRITDFRRAAPLSGGGGTDLEVGLQAALNDRPRPGLLVAITDGYTPWPDRPTPVPLVVILLHDGDIPETPSWATTITVEANQLSAS